MNDWRRHALLSSIEDECASGIRLPGFYVKCPGSSLECVIAKHRMPGFGFSLVPWTRVVHFLPAQQYYYGYDAKGGAWAIGLKKETVAPDLGPVPVANWTKSTPGSEDAPLTTCTVAIVHPSSFKIRTPFHTDDQLLLELATAHSCALFARPGVLRDPPLALFDLDLRSRQGLT